ncbi:MAG: hypothetical protein QXH37_01190 [Candidatus Bathyarchaeia archaeon]
MWLIENKDSGSLVDAAALAQQITKLGLDAQKTVKPLMDEYWLREVPVLGKFGVT